MDKLKAWLSKSNPRWLTAAVVFAVLTVQNVVDVHPLMVGFGMAGFIAVFVVMFVEESTE